MIGYELCLDIGQLFRVGKIFTLFEFTYILVDGDQYILKKLYVRVVAGGQGVLTWILRGM